MTSDSQAVCTTPADRENLQVPIRAKRDPQPFQPLVRLRVKSHDSRLSVCKSVRTVHQSVDPLPDNNGKGKGIIVVPRSRDFFRDPVLRVSSRSGLLNSSRLGAKTRLIGRPEPDDVRAPL